MTYKIITAKTAEELQIKVFEEKSFGGQAIFTGNTSVGFSNEWNQHVAVLQYQPRPYIVCLCGSTRFTDVMLAVRWMLEKQNIIVMTWNVLPVGYGAHVSHQAEAEGVKEQLDALHKSKILMSDSVLVVNPNSYIGESTQSEINFADQYNKPIYTLWNEDTNTFHSEIIFHTVNKIEGLKVKLNTKQLDQVFDLPARVLTGDWDACKEMSPFLTEYTKFPAIPTRANFSIEKVDMSSALENLKKRFSDGDEGET